MFRAEILLDAAELQQLPQATRRNAQLALFLYALNASALGAAPLVVRFYEAERDPALLPEPPRMVIEIEPAP